MTLTKVCKQCKQNKTLDQFSKHSLCKLGVCSKCKKCRSLEWAARKEEHSTYKKSLYQRRKSYYLPKAKAYYASHKQEKAAYDEKYKPRRRPLRNQRHKERYENDPQYRITHNLRGSLHTKVKRSGYPKLDSAMNLLGCSIADFRAYIEARFLPGMSWENHGRYGWHIDHIRPCASFDLTNLEEQKKCFHYTNLQPLWAKDNLLKGSSL